LYGQLLGEMGCVGAAAFAAILLGTWWNIRRIRLITRSHPEWGTDFAFELSRGIGLAILLLLFEGNLGHNLFRHNWLWFGAFLIVARHCVELRHARGVLSGIVPRPALPRPAYGNAAWAMTRSRGPSPAVPRSTSWRM
jgi:hypothetical protein